MDITATLQPDEFRDFLGDLFPCELRLDPDDDRKRLYLEAPRDLLFEPDERVVRVSTGGRVCWPVPVVGDGFGLKRVDVDLIPRVVRRAELPHLEIRFALRELDVRYVPAFVDEALLRRVNHALRKLDVRADWAFCDTLTNRVELPEYPFPPTALAMFVTSGSVQIHRDRIELSVPMKFHLKHGTTVHAPVE